MIAAVLPASPAAAAVVPTTMILGSGIFGPNATDIHTQVSVDGGPFGLAVGVTPRQGWGSLTNNSNWISTDADPAVATSVTAVFKRDFTLPAGLLTTNMSVCVLGVDDVTVRLNGTVIGSQTAGDAGNAADPADCFNNITTGMVPGDNTLEFTVPSSADTLALDYRALLGYTEETETPPVLLLPDDITVPAESAQGANVGYSFQAIDDTLHLFVSASCSPGSGLFPVGTTTVNCYATGHSGLVSNDSFTVTVLPFAMTDQPPVLSLPGDMTVTTTSLSGKRVSYAATATDDSGIPPTVTCVPPSGSVFPVGVTTVECTATDDQNLSSSGTFSVTVIGPLQRACSLLQESLSVTLKTLLVSKLKAAGDALYQARRWADSATIRSLAVKVKNSHYTYLKPALRQYVQFVVRTVMGHACTE
jgi:hypothetical protein